MKYSRLLIGAFLVLFTVWIIVGEQVSGASADAVVNAEVVTVRSNVAGELNLTARPLGSRVAEGDLLGSISNTLVDAVRLDDLNMEGALAAAAVRQIEAEIGQLKRQHDALKVRSDAYHSERTDELRQRLEHARNCLAILEERGPGAEQGERLVDAAGGTAEGIPGGPTNDALAIEHAREHVAVLEISLAAAEKGVFLGDGYNDAPNSEQRAIELAGQIARLSTRLVEAQERKNAISERIARERVRVSAHGGGEIVAPVTGIYWEVLEADGITVQRGDPILRIVNCGSTMVTLSVSERVYNSLALGAKATFRLEGQAKTYPATISRLAGSGAATIYRNLAIAPSERHLERYDVTLLVPGLASEAGCIIGQTGRVFFDRRPLDWLRSIFA